MLLMLAGALLLQEPAAQSATTAAPAAPAPAVKEKRICRNMEEDSTSRMGRRVCKLESEWAKGQGGSTGRGVISSRPTDGAN